MGCQRFVLKSWLLRPQREHLWSGLVLVPVCLHGTVTNQNYLPARSCFQDALPAVPYTLRHSLSSVTQLHHSPGREGEEPHPCVTCESSWKWTQFAPGATGGTVRHCNVPWGRKLVHSGTNGYPDAKVSSVLKAFFFQLCLICPSYPRPWNQ